MGWSRRSVPARSHTAAQHSSAQLSTAQLTPDKAWHRRKRTSGWGCGGMAMLGIVPTDTVGVTRGSVAPGNPFITRTHAHTATQRQRAGGESGQVQRGSRRAASERTALTMSGVVRVLRVHSWRCWVAGTALWGSVQAHARQIARNHDTGAATGGFEWRACGEGDNDTTAATAIH